MEREMYEHVRRGEEEMIQLFREREMFIIPVACGQCPAFPVCTKAETYILVNLEDG